MTDTPRPWDRRTAESDPAFEAFAAYLDTGSRRDAYRQRSGNEKATPSHRRDSQSASRHAAIREQRQRLREHLIQPGVLERHEIPALDLRLAPQFLELRCHVVPDRAGRDIRDLLHRPFDAHTVLVGVHLRPFLGQLLRDRPGPSPSGLAWRRPGGARRCSGFVASPHIRRCFPSVQMSPTRDGILRRLRDVVRVRLAGRCRQRQYVVEREDVQVVQPGERVRQEVGVPGR